MPPVRGSFHDLGLPGSVYVGRGHGDFELQSSIWANPFRSSLTYLGTCLLGYKAFILKCQPLVCLLPCLAGATLICHCEPLQPCHVDSLILLCVAHKPLHNVGSSWHVPSVISSKLLELAARESFPQTVRENATGTGLCLGLTSNAGVKVINEGPMAWARIAHRGFALVLHEFAN